MARKPALILNTHLHPQRTTPKDSIVHSRVERLVAITVPGFTPPVGRWRYLDRLGREDGDVLRLGLHEEFTLRFPASMTARVSSQTQETEATYIVYEQLVAALDEIELI